MTDEDLEARLKKIFDGFYSDRRNYKKHGNAKENAYTQAMIGLIQLAEDQFGAITRLETIDHTPCKNCKGEGYLQGIIKMEECKICHGAGFLGRSVVFWDKNKQIQLSLQDSGLTMKIFISERDK